jgi:hypothetical protein
VDAAAKTGGKSREQMVSVPPQADGNMARGKGLIGSIHKSEFQCRL